MTVNLMTLLLRRSMFLMMMPCWLCINLWACTSPDIVNRITTKFRLLIFT